MPALKLSGQMPELGKVIDCKLGDIMRPGKHSMSEGRRNLFLDPADNRFGRVKPD